MDDLRRFECHLRRIVVFLRQVGIGSTSSSSGTFLRATAVFLFAMAIVLAKKEIPKLKTVGKRNWLFLTLSGVMTGVCWFLGYAAFNYEGSNAVTITSVGEFSIALTMLFLFLVLKEKFSKKMPLGLLLLLGGIVIVAAFAL